MERVRGRSLLIDLIELACCVWEQVRIHNPLPIVLKHNFQFGTYQANSLWHGLIIIFVDIHTC